MVSWPAVPGARSYDIVRRVAGAGSQAFLPLAAGLTETSYVDAEASRNVYYEYIVVASDGTCSSRYGAESSSAPSSHAGGERVAIRPPLRFR